MRRGLAIGLALGGAMLAAGGWAVGPGAAPLVDALADGRSVWRLGELHVSDVRGAWIGDLTAGRVTVSDARGAWLEARDVRLRWRPSALLLGRLVVTDAVVGDATMARRPELGPPPESRGARFAVEARSLRITTLRIEEAVAGVTATVAMDGHVETTTEALRRIAFTAVRADQPTDRVALGYDPEAENPWVLQAEGSPGGVLAGLLGADPEAGVSLLSEASGSGSSGTATARLLIGEEEAFAARGGWSEGGWQAEGTFDVATAPGLGLGSRLGGAGRFTAEGGEGGAIVAAVIAPALEARLEGLWDGDMRLVAQTDELGTLLALESAPAQRLALAGVVRRGDAGLRFQGQAQVDGLSVAGLSGSAAGPVALTMDRRRIVVSYEANVTGAWNGTPLRSSAGVLRYDRQEGALRIERIGVVGDALSVSGRGAFDRFEGDVEVSALGAFTDVLNGAARATFTLTREGDAWEVAAEGVGDGIRAEAPAGELLGPRPRFEVTGSMRDGSLIVRQLIISGARLRAGVQGRVVEDELDLTWEASARGPVSVSGVGVNGAVDATGRILGSVAAPRVSGAAGIAEIDLGAATLTEAAVRFAVADGQGAVTVSALYGAAPFTATGDVIVRDRTVAIEGLQADLAGLTAAGGVSVRDGGLTGALTVDGTLAALTGQSGVVRAGLTLSGTGAAPVIATEGVISAAQFGALRVDQASFSANGPLTEVRFIASGSGALGEEAIELAAQGEARLSDGAFSLTAAAQGRVGETGWRTTEPLTLRQEGGRRMVNGVLAVGAGTASVSWREDGDGFAGEALVQDVPVSALSWVAGADAEGQATGTVALRNRGQRLEGSLDLAVSGLRAPGRMRMPVTLQLSGQLQNETVTASVRATSADGLSADAAVSAAVNTGAAPLRIAQDPGQAGRIIWDIDGPAGAVWALVGTPDQSVSGEISGRGEAQFGPGVLSGSGALTLSDGAFEDRLSGVRLRDVAMRASFSDQAVIVEQVSATDGDGGRLSGFGQIDGARRGSLTLDLDGLRFINREDSAARADGRLTFAWEPGGAVLSGALTLTEATIRGAPSGNADIPTLDVIEINRPGGDAPARGVRGVARSGPPTRLALSVNAPQRVFTRYRGLDAEWSLDLSVRGTTAAPELYGETQLLRGEAQLAGRPLEFSRGLVRFRGAPEEAELDIVAVQDSADFRAEFVLTGTVQQPEISVSNDRGLPDDEVLPLLLFGATPEELSPLQAAQLAASLSALTGGSAFDLVDITRRIVGLDRFDVRQEGDGIVVAGGRYLTRDVYVEVARSGLGEAQTRVEWRLTNSLRLITSFAEDGEQRVSLRWRQDEDR